MPAIASVSRLDDIHRSHQIARLSQRAGTLELTVTIVVLDTGIKLGSLVNDGALPKVIKVTP